MTERKLWRRPLLPGTSHAERKGREPGTRGGGDFRKDEGRTDKVHPQRVLSISGAACSSWGFLGGGEDISEVLLILSEGTMKEKDASIS